MVNRRSVLCLFPGALLLAACADSKVTTIRIGAVGGAQGRNSSTTNMRIAEEKGFFEQEFSKDGIKVEVIYFTGTGPAMNEAFAQGQLDFAEYGGLPNVIGLAGGAPTRMLIGRHSSSTYYAAAGVRPDRPGITKVADLKGRSVAVQMGTMPHLLLVRLLEANGLTEKDVKIVNLQSAEANAAFAGGAVDALWGSTALLKLADSGQARIVGSTRDLASQAQNLGGFLVHKDFEARHPDLTQRVAKVAVHTYHWASQDENRDELLGLYARSGLPVGYYAQEYPTPLRQRFSPLIDGAIREGYRQIGQFAYEHKLVRKSPDFTGWFEPKYQQQAIRELGLEGYWLPETASSDLASAGAQ